MKKKAVISIISLAIILVLGISIYASFSIYIKKEKEKPQKALKQYMSYIEKEKYEEAYEMLSKPSKQKISKEQYIKRNKNIYSGIGLKEIRIKINSVQKVVNKEQQIAYGSTLNTLAGEIAFSNSCTFAKEEKQYKLNWTSNQIFPMLDETDKVKVKFIEASRGQILDRNGQVLAKDGFVSAVGFVPGKMNENKAEDIKKASQLLEISEDSINKLLAATYVKKDTFVQLKRTSSDNKDLIENLLKIKGIKIIDSPARVYPEGEVAGHITGYIQEISKEELEVNKNNNYTATTLIGKTGLEKTYEKTLRGIEGCIIEIVTSEGISKEVVKQTEMQNGKDLKTTIDIYKQRKIYNQLKAEKGLCVIMNPKNGEMLSLVSTPSFNPNDFIVGMSNEKWNNLNNKDTKPLYNRYTASWCPGSTFKPITGAIGLTTGKIQKDEDFGHSGLTYIKDKSWGTYNITTLKEYNGPANLENALINSDNIYFAKAGMKIGADIFSKNLINLGFHETFPLEQPVAQSTFSKNKKIEREISLADSAYGQGEILVNPVHMASIYSAFVNDGNMVKPHIEYKETDNVEYIKQEVFSKEAANTIREDLIQVVENKEGTAKKLKLSGVKIAAKTGTAELKTTKTETNAKRLSWLNAFTANLEEAEPLLVISMREIDSDETFTNNLFQVVRSVFEK
ncbi:MAG: penicillin-binding transpeptidase domain-containing protein [Clostridia bacterium]